MRFIHLALSASMLSLGLLSGCETPKPQSPDDCAKIDWHRAGSRAVAAGTPVESAWHAARGPLCAEKGWPQDRDAFGRGYTEGLPGYCSPRNGLTQGRADRSYRGICPPYMEAEFKRAHDMGRVLNKADDDKSSAESRLSRARGIANDEKKPTKEREDARRDIATHQTARDNANARITSLEATAAQLGWGIGR